MSAFSTTPAFYTIERELGSTWALRGRLGLAFGADDANLLYGTAGSEPRARPRAPPVRAAASAPQRRSLRMAS